ncbi:MAG TPA: sorbosone dehydrogenase family protein [Bacteroidota bacterium]|nr:sorbosone dehydrogenase family protein [Bacteroidota bacterium]
MALSQDSRLPLDKIKLPHGFHIAMYAEVPNARSLTLGSKGTVFVGSRSDDHVYAVIDANKDGKAEKVYPIGKGLNTPNGVAFYHGSLYVAEISRILRFDDIENRFSNPPAPVVVTDSYPTEKSHGWKFIAFGPDGKLYVPVGAPCNVCDEKDPIYASITRLNPNGTEREIYARGIRNTVGFDWHPQTKELWFTDNGRDMMGDDVPDDELNCAPKKGLHFGFPYIHQGDVFDPEYGQGKKLSDYVAPVQNLGPHVAALGMRFYTGTMFPAEYRNQILIAEHGSWNRSTPIGYRLTCVKLKGNTAVSYAPFAEGWLDGRRAWGRPVDVLVMPDGALLVSDDQAGVIYRITYSKK